jgi:DNA-directed RNA polymerase specialized sigma subunit
VSADPSASEERIIAHLQFARAVASRSIDPRCRGADREDLIAWGVVGLVQAARKMKPLSRAGRGDALSCRC